MPFLLAYDRAHNSSHPRTLTGARSVPLVSEDTRVKIRRCFGWQLLDLLPDHQDGLDLRQVSAYEAAPGMEAALLVPNAEDLLVGLQ